MSILRRAKALIQEHQERHNAIQPKINALKAKIRELETSTAVPYEEYSAVLTELNRRNDPDRIDGNGLRIGIGGTTPYVRLINTLKQIPKTAPNHSKHIENNINQLQRLADEALFNDERAVEVTRLIILMVRNKRIPTFNAQQIIKLFRYNPPGTVERKQAEQLLAATKYI